MDEEEKLIVDIFFEIGFYLVFKVFVKEVFKLFELDKIFYFGIFFCDCLVYEFFFSIVGEFFIFGYFVDLLVINGFGNCFVDLLIYVWNYKNYWFLNCFIIEYFYCEI